VVETVRVWFALRRNQHCGAGDPRRSDAMGDETVKVVVRCRPPNSKETSEGRKNCVIVHSAEGQLAITNPSTEGSAAPDVKTFSFDSVYDPDSTQKQVYEETAFPLVESVLTGYNGTIFA